jgi:hypothetical protein
MEKQENALLKASDISPDFAGYIIEFPFGDNYTSQAIHMDVMMVNLDFINISIPHDMELIIRL